MTTTPNPSFDLDALRATQKARGEKHLWRGLEDLADTAEHRAFLEHEFPNDPEKDGSTESGEASGGVHRRDVLKWMAASAALAGLSGCTKMPEQKIVPYVRPPEEIIPGRPLFYATSMTMGGVATGILVESNMGRPTKVEGNPLHPASLGATDIFAQASVLGLYDPDRSQTVVHEGRISTWGTFVSQVNDLRNNFAVTKGAGLRILTETITSPSLAAQIQALLKEFPEAKWHQWEPCSRNNVWLGTAMALGRYAEPIYKFDKADVILSLDADFLYSGPGAVRYARDFASRRLSGDGAANSQAKMNRLYVVEQGSTTTGAMADHRLAIRAGDIAAFASALAAALHVPLGSGNVQPPPGVPAGWIEALAHDLQNHRGACVVVAGEQQPAAVHNLAHAINAALGNENATIVYENLVASIDGLGPAEIKALVDDMAAGDVKALFILSGNPVYSAPADLTFSAHLLKVPFRAHVGLYEDETAELCHWHIPAAHFLESWGDARAYDGAVGLMQPLIAPLYDGKSPSEIVSAIQGHADKNGHDLLQEFWKTQKNDKEFQSFWETALHDGVVAAGPAPPAIIAVKLGPMSPSAIPALKADEVEIVFRPDPTIYDGRFANNGWLQEAPKPITKLTWDNTAQLSPATAQKLGVENGDVVHVVLNSRGVEAPVWIVPGQANNSVTVHLGYGRRKAGRVGTGVGFNAYLLQDSASPWIASGVQIIKTGKKYKLAPTQHHNIIDVNGHPEEMESQYAFKRDLVRIATLDEFNKNPKFAQDEAEPEPPKELSLYPGFKYEGYAWGLAIDLNKCVGCGACVLACQAENNIPVVGKEQVIAGREMHWIRVDTYFRGDVDQPETYFEPVPCMHCENAPCEGVCPVGATVHSPEGLNEMVYNRCVGTRYCSNNCPYKVRRFNFELFADFTTESLMSLRNPNVSVRSRGVMEKCTYCVQRIQSAKIDAEKQDRSVRDGDIVTACEAVCPAQAIVFGNINDKNSRVAKLKASTRDYTLLAELNTRPRTSYQARLRNPNPAMSSFGKAE
ncbi:MAG TPA: TAT-variant-translocated molybdopterin oxidoreductase [Candidatus Acidoferrales bacterium]